MNGGTLNGSGLTVSGTFNSDAGGILSGSFSVPGGITVDSGTLTGNAAIAADVVISGGTLSGNCMTITGNIDVNSGGLLSGTTTISGGANDIQVNSGGTLGGVGTITSTTNSIMINNNGTVSPGNSIGTTNVVGDITFASGAILHNEISSTPGDSDLLNVTGAVTVDLGAILLIDPRAGVYLFESMYTVLTTTTGVNRAFDTLNFTAPGLQGTSTSDGTSNFFTITTGTHVNLHLFTSAHNPEQVALCLNGEAIESGTDFEAVAFQLQTLENIPLGIHNALDQLQPAIFGSLNLIQESQMTLVQSTFSHRLQAWGNGGCIGLSPNTWNLWVKPIGQFISQDSHGEQVGYNTRAFGGMIGADGTIGNSFHLGLATGYVFNDVDWKRSRGTAHSHNFYGAAYAALQKTNFHILATFVTGWNGYHGKRFIKFANLRRKATHNNDGYVLGTHIEGAYSYVKKGTRLQPFGKFEYTYSTQDDYKESGASSLNLRVQRKSSDRIRTDAGLDLSHCFKTKSGQIVPNVYVSWVWEKEAKSGIMKSRFNNLDCTMNLHAFRPVRSIFAPGVGLTGVFCNESISLALRWDGEFAKRYSNQRALVEATFGF